MEDSRVLLLEQEFRSYKEHRDKEIIEMKKFIEDLQKRILTMEKSKEKTDYQYDQIMEMLNKLNNITIPSLVAQVEELKNKPVKRYDQIITVAISTIVGGIIGFIINIFLGGN